MAADVNLSVVHDALITSIKAFNFLWLFVFSDFSWAYVHILGGEEYICLEIKNFVNDGVTYWQEMAIASSWNSEIKTSRRGRIKRTCVYLILRENDSLLWLYIFWMYNFCPSKIELLTFEIYPCNMHFYSLDNHAKRIYKWIVTIRWRMNQRINKLCIGQCITFLFYSWIFDMCPDWISAFIGKWNSGGYNSNFMSSLISLIILQNSINRGRKLYQDCHL